MTLYNVEYTDTFGGEANYCWVYRETVEVPELTHYGYDGTTGYAKARRSQRRELMRLAKAAVGITGVRGRSDDSGDMISFRPYGSCTILHVTYSD